MRIICILTVTFFVLCACQNKTAGRTADAAAAPDTLVYQIKTLKKTTGPCQTKEDLCSTVEFSYPVFAGDSTSAINEWVVKQMGEGYMDTMIHVDIGEVMQQFLDNFDTTLKKIPEMAQQWQYQKSIRVEKQYRRFITLHIYTYEFAGGAHPNYMDNYYHYDLKLHHTLSIKDFVTEGSEVKVTKAGEELFRKEFHLSDNTSLDTGQFFFKNGIFYLPSDFYFTAAGIRFHYNDAEIRPHVEGPYDLLIPYERIRDLIRPDSYLPDIAQGV